MQTSQVLNMLKLKNIFKMFNFNPILIVLTLAILNVLSSNLTKSMSYPILSLILNVLYILVFFILLYHIGFSVVYLLSKKFKIIDDDTASIDAVDYISVGLLFNIIIGIIGGLIGILSSWYYALIIISLFYFSRHHHEYKFRILNYKMDFLLLIGMILISIFLFSGQLITNLVLNELKADVYVQYLPQIKAVIHSGKIMPTPFAGENRVHEYYYQILNILPVVLPSFLESLSFFNLGLQIFSCLLVFYGISRIYNRSIAICGAIFTFILLTASVFIPDYNIPLEKSTLRFFILMYSLSFMYLLLFEKINCYLYLWISVFATALLSGTTIVGTYFAAGTFMALFLLYINRRINLNIILSCMLIIGTFFILPKIINLFYTGSFIDYITRCYFGLFQPIEFKEYLSDLDKFIMENWWFGEKNQANIPKITFIFLKTALFSLNGIFVLASILLAFLFQRKTVFGKLMIIYNILMFIMLCLSSSIDIRHSIYVIPWYAVAMAHTLYFIIDFLKRFPFLSFRKVYTYFALTCCIFIFIDYRFLTFITVLRIETSRINIVSTLERLENARCFINSREFKQIKSHFINSELVFNMGFSQVAWSEFYDYVPIHYSQIINKIMYYKDPKQIINALKKLNIRYVLITTADIHSPRPTLFEKQYGGRYLQILAENPMSFYTGQIKRLPYVNNPRYRGIFLKIFYEPLPTDNEKVLKLLDKLEFNEDQKFKSVLTNEILSDSVINRIRDSHDKIYKH